MFIEVNCKNGSSRCFEVKLITFDPKEGISIYGEQDRVCISPDGDIKTSFSFPRSSELNEVENCKVPKMIFKKNNGELDDYNDDYADDDECLLPENGGLLGNLMNPMNTKGEEILVQSCNVSEEISEDWCCKTVDELYRDLVNLLV